MPYLQDALCKEVHLSLVRANKQSRSSCYKQGWSGFNYDSLVLNPA